MSGKRTKGRPPKGAYKEKTATLTTRITPELRSALDTAARKNKVSLSQEIEHRLRNSFDREMQRDWRDRLADDLGGKKTFALLLVISQFVQGIEMLTGKRWHDDPYTIEEVGKGIIVILNRLAPPGEPTPPESLRWEHDTPLHLAAALGLLTTVQLSELPRQLPGRSETGGKVILSDPIVRSATVKELLGNVAKRLEAKR